MLQGLELAGTRNRCNRCNQCNRCSTGYVATPRQEKQRTFPLRPLQKPAPGVPVPGRLFHGVHGSRCSRFTFTVFTVHTVNARHCPQEKSVLPSHRTQSEPNGTQWDLTGLKSFLFFEAPVKSVNKR